ncbi:DUF305 domain-containing protein [Microbacterium ureisolvens]|uniref:DUF305 domain-containing protein n=1 Tax=Microbacterium ureisolvens TaxID=2781186 RepID=A0ABS7HV98_9MICO|nr:DUF305 domain-containing protein [Microbacterium ureisolvens]MBW9108541.1 DUF305 domain-containing protein [Microbacterium ureisolvens]
MNHHRTRALLAALPLAIALGLAGCANGSGGPGSMPGMDHASPMPSGSASAVSMADQMFVVMMIPHHEQAIEMSDVILEDDGVDSRVSELAERIKGAQGPEIELMQGWLDEWGVPHDTAAAGGMDHGGGMMSEADMTALREADGEEAGRLFLEQMIVHHEGAVEMAEAALDDGEDPDVLALAQRVIDDQTAEIAEMQELLTKL